MSAMASSALPVPVLWNSFSPCRNEPSGNNRQAYFECVCVQSACTCPCTCLCLRACMDICVQCMCQGQLFLLFLSRASGKSPSSLSKRSFLWGMAIDCHRSPPLINPSQRQSTQSETSAAENFCLFNFRAGSLGLVCCEC